MATPRDAFRVRPSSTGYLGPLPTPPTSNGTITGPPGLDFDSIGMDGLTDIRVMVDIDALASVESSDTTNSAIDVSGPGRQYTPEVIDYAPEISPTCGEYSCPYRKRNPRIFNVCDFTKCALGSFNTISEVKRHVIGNHQSKDFPYQCRICTSRFRKRNDLDKHFNSQPCRKPLTTNDHENGINEVMLAILKDRRQGSRVETWEDLWRVIFPDCDPMTPDFIPPRLAQKETEEANPCPEDSDRSTAIDNGQSTPSLNPQQGSLDCQVQPTIHRKATMPLKQVGVARVHIEILSLSERDRRFRRNETRGLDGFDSETSSETDTEWSDDDDACNSEAQDSDGSPGGTSTRTASTVGNTSQGEVSTSGTSQTTPAGKRNRTGEREDDENNNERPGKRRRRQPRDENPTKLRFACPYQVAGLSNNCFMLAQNNPTGGCACISRLRDHLTRKHMKSYRCVRCWKQFNARNKALAHPESNCIQKEMPRYEIFMTPQQEIDVENCSGVHPDDTWWNIFQLLIPDISEHELSQLKNSFRQYYFPVDSSLLIPFIYLNNPSFQSTSSQLSLQPNGIGATPASLDLPPDPLPALGSSTLGSQTFNTPIFEAPMVPSSIPSFDSTTFSGTQQSAGSDSTAPSDRINASSTPASSLNLTPSAAAETSQMQRNYERQKTRAAQAEAENGELRATISASREQVSDAAVLLDGVLDIANLDNEVYEQVSRAVGILRSVTRRL